ncbi:MAG TPA: hypothetical protein VMJ30_04025 [Gemmatimonadales bacterium]|nr:hypothetical protein [Gemmatimonadales bacterium]
MIPAVRAQLSDLRRVSEALGGIRGRTVEGCALRSDHRQFRVELSDGLMLVVGVDRDEQGRPRLTVDVARNDEGPAGQLEVPFGTGR